MAKPEPNMNEWLTEAKASENAAKCGMILTHNGIVRITPKAQVREGVMDLGEIARVDFSYDEAALAAAVEEALTWEGIYFVKAWLNEGACAVGDSLMYVMIGGDIRPRVIEALQNLVGKIKAEIVIEKEILAR
ncbi:MAG: molybdopterin biosynthesis protein [Eggerthellaceae bacterium]|nr:molybdopterin biosynthesis protein [Eggerthellaceae bacterium]